MKRKTFLAWPVVCGVMVAACAGTPDTPLSPSAATPSDAFLNADGTSVKVPSPTGLQPNGVVLDTRRPTLSFENARTAAVTGVAFDYEIEMQNEAGNVVYSAFPVRGTSSGRTEHTVAADTEYDINLWWRTRVRISGEAGSWSDFAMVRTQTRPAPPPPPATIAPTGSGVLPFIVPPACAAGDPGGCVFAMVGASPWWPACAAGSGTNCHRFTRSVAAALATVDQNYGLITKNPGEQQCSWNSCGSGDGSGYGEDVLAYHTGGGNWFGWDIVVGAGGPGAGPNFAPIGSRRPGNNWAPVPPFP